MDRTAAQSSRAAKVLVLVELLQERFVQALATWGGVTLDPMEWFRDEGRHGGGVRYGTGDTERLGRASVNVSQVHYDDEPLRRLRSATALSTIVHPAHPQAPSVHIHISWTEIKDGSGYWRIMADLNPAILRPEQTERFIDALRKSAPSPFDEAREQGDRYFYIPALNRHRGVVHFYLENYDSGSFEDDIELAGRVGRAAIDGYMQLLSEPVTSRSEEDAVLQLNYHTLYLFQVLTLDRGTTAGLMVHDQNDLGIMGSLPPRINRELLASWRPRMVAPQEQLLDGIVAALPDAPVCTIDEGVKLRLADVVRRHYQRHPEALDLQASGNSEPPTMDNHLRPAG